MFGNSLDVYLLAKSVELYQVQTEGTELEFEYSYQMSYYEANSFNSGPEYTYIRANDIDDSSILEENRFQTKVETNDKLVNQYNLIEGELPTKENEIVLNASFARNKGYEVGDTVLINGGSTVTGLVEFPNYLYPLISDTKLIVDMQNQGIVLMPSSSFSSSNFGLQNRDAYNINFFIAYNDLYAQPDAYTADSFSQTANIAIDRAQMFNQFLEGYFINPIDNFQPVTG